MKSVHIFFCCEGHYVVVNCCKMSLFAITHMTIIQVVIWDVGWAMSCSMMVYLLRCSDSGLPDVTRSWAQNIRQSTTLWLLSSDWIDSPCIHFTHWNIHFYAVLLPHTLPKWTYRTGAASSSSSMSVSSLESVVSSSLESSVLSSTYCCSRFRSSSSFTNTFAKLKRYGGVITVSARCARRHVSSQDTTNLFPNSGGWHWEGNICGAYRLVRNLCALVQIDEVLSSFFCASCRSTHWFVWRLLRCGEGLLARTLWLDNVY